MSKLSTLRKSACVVLLAVTMATIPATLIGAQSTPTPDDIDGDGTPNAIDDDDDGDGIPDLDEFGPCNTSARVVWDHNDSDGQGQAATFQDGAEAHLAATTDLFFGPGIFESFDASFTYIFDGADASDLAGAQTNGDYVQISLTPDVDIELTGIGYGFFTTPGGAGAGLDNFQIASSFATTANFTDETILQQGIQVPDLQSGYITPPTPSVQEILAAGTEYFFRFYLFDAQNNDPELRVRFDDLSLPFNVLSSCFIDTDEDGTPDHLDPLFPPTTTTTTAAPTTTTAAPTTTTAPTTTAAPTTTSTTVASNSDSDVAGSDVTTTTSTTPPTTTTAANVASAGVDAGDELPQELALTGPTSTPIALGGAAALVLGAMMVTFERRRIGEV